MDPTGQGFVEPRDDQLFTGTETEAIEVDEEELKAQAAAKQQEFQASLSEREVKEQAENAKVDAEVERRREETEADNLNPIQKMIEENLVIPISDMLDSSRNAEQIASDRAEERTAFDEEKVREQVKSDLDPNFFKEASRALIGGPMDFFKETLETADLFGDTVKTWMGIASEEDKVWEEDGSKNLEYKRAEYNITMSENQTPIGGFVRGSLKFLTGLVLLRKVPLLGANPVGRNLASRASRIGMEGTRGLAVDFLAIDSDDETMVQSAAQMFGVEEDHPLLGTIVKAMTIDDDSNPWEAKIKGMAEGGVLGASLDSVAETIGILRRGRKYKEALLTKAAKTKAKKEGIDFKAALKFVKASPEEQAKLADEALAKAAQEINADKPKVQPEQVAEEAAMMADPAFQRDPNFQFDDIVDDDVPLRWQLNDVEIETKRQAQDIAYGGSPVRPAMYEIDEKAARLTTNNANDVAVAQSRIEPHLGDTDGRSVKPLLNDAAVKQINGEAFTESTLGQMTAGLPKASADALKTKLREVGSTIDIKDISSRMRLSADEYKVRTFDTIRRLLGAESGADTQAILSAASKLNRDTGFETLTDTQMVATKTVIVDLATQINDTVDVGLDLLGTGRDLPFAQADSMLDRLSALTKAYKQTTMDWGRFGVLMKNAGPLKLGYTEAEIAKSLNDIDNVFKDAKDKLRGGDEKAIQEVKLMMNGLALADGDPLKIMTWGALGKQLGWQAAWKSFYNSLLSGPITHARNAIGNAGVMVLRPMTMALGYTMQGNLGAAKASMASMSAIMDSFPEALTAGGKAFKKGSMNGGGKFDIAGMKGSETARAIEILKQNADTPAKQITANWIGFLHQNAFMNAPANALNAGDDFFKIMNARMELKRRVMMESLDEAGTIRFNPERYEALVKEKIVDGQINDEGLLQLAKESTFQQDLEGFASKLQATIESNPLAKYAVPFIRTPHNLAVYAGTHMPGVGLFLKESQTILNGTDEAAKAMLYGRQAMGFGVLATGFGFASQQLLTGNGPADPDLNRIWRESNQPQSIKIGDKWVSYASIEPLNVMFAAAADLQQIGPFLPEKDFERITGQLYWTFAKAFTERSYFKGIQSAVGYLNPGTVGNVNFEREGFEFVNTAIPFAGLRRQLSKALAPDMLEYNTELQRFVAGFGPGGTMAAKVLGAETMISPFSGKSKWEDKNGNIALHALNQFLPFNITDAATDPVLTKLQDYLIDTNTEMGETYKGMDLTPTDMQNINRLMYEGGLNEALADVFDSKAFKDGYYEWEKLVASGRPAPRKEMGWYGLVTDVISESRARAARNWAAMDPDENKDFADRLRMAQQLRKAKKENRTDDLKQLLDFANP